MHTRKKEARVVFFGSFDSLGGDDREDLLVLKSNPSRFRSAGVDADAVAVAKTKKGSSFPFKTPTHTHCVPQLFSMLLLPRILKRRSKHAGYSRTATCQSAG